MGLLVGSICVVRELDDCRIWHLQKLAEIPKKIEVEDGRDHVSCCPTRQKSLRLPSSVNFCESPVFNIVEVILNE